MPTHSHDGELEGQIRNLLAQNRKLEAVKIYRERTGVSLLEAKTAVKGIESVGDLPPRGSAEVGDVDAEILSVLRQGTKLEAVKRYKQKAGCSLVEARQAVESIATKNGVVIHEGSGCIGAIVVFVILAVVAVGVVAVSMFVSGKSPWMQ